MIGQFTIFGYGKEAIVERLLVFRELHNEIGRGVWKIFFEIFYVVILISNFERFGLFLQFLFSLLEILR